MNLFKIVKLPGNNEKGWEESLEMVVGAKPRHLPFLMSKLVTLRSASRVPEAAELCLL